MSGIIDFKELCKLIELYKGRRVAITFHAMADRDSVSSAVALYQYLQKATIVTPDFIARSSERMLEELGYSYDIERSFKNPEVIIVVDANNLDSLGDLKAKIQSSNAEVLFIDHHALPTTLLRNATVFNDESFSATASIVYEFLKKKGFDITENLAKLLLYGIAADSADFKNATSLTFSQVSELLKISDSNYGEILYEMSSRASSKVRQQAISEIFNSTIDLCGDYVLIYGETKMHANDAAERALSIGADVTVFWSIRKEEVSISARMYPNLDRKLSLHLGRLMQSIGPIIKGSGGGHPCAAGAYGPAIANADDAVSKILLEIKDRMLK